MNTDTIAKDIEIRNLLDKIEIGSGISSNDLKSYLKNNTSKKFKLFTIYRIQVLKDTKNSSPSSIFINYGFWLYMGIDEKDNYVFYNCIKLPEDKFEVFPSVIGCDCLRIPEKSLTGYYTIEEYKENK